ncbi:MAG: HAD family phosphatase [Candidatus Thorarchaeota archaeon]|nr:HAD family phosphatase [Candidatus Thorarchaeota archaeon]MCK5238628.1 HAD family phosphatase [Candidatus Thorarchaeota archaeon]
MGIRLVVFDLDGTLTTHNSSWWQLHQHFNTHEEGGFYYDQYFAGEIDYQQWADLDAALWKGQKLSDVEKLADEAELMPGAIQVVKDLKNSGIQVAVLSGGIDILAERIVKRIGIDYLLVNKIHHENGIITGKVDVNVGWGGKAEEIKQVCDHFNIPLSETAFVGDGKNDIAVFPVVALSIAFNPEDDEVAEAASVVIRKKDLREVLSVILPNQ